MSVLFNTLGAIPCHSCPPKKSFGQQDFEYVEWDVGSRSFQTD